VNIFSEHVGKCGEDGRLVLQCAARHHNALQRIAMRCGSCLHCNTWHCVVVRTGWIQGSFAKATLLNNVSFAKDGSFARST